MTPETPNIGKALLSRREAFSHDQLAEEFGVGVETVKSVFNELVEKGYRFVDNDGLYIRTRSHADNETFDARRIFRGGLLHFGLVSDTHLGNKLARVDALNAMYDRFEKEGVKTVFHVGDWTDGYHVFPGQEFELQYLGQDEQIAYTIKNYPKRDGIITVGISGNHDLKMYERGGVDPLIPIAGARKDIIYLGQYTAKVRLGAKTNMELTHPRGNTAYALSYKAQRDINNRSPGDLPNVLVYGHYHTSFMMNYRGIDFIQTPCFKDGGLFEHRLGLNPTIGGWIINGVSNGETISEFSPRLFVYGQKD